MLTYDGTLAVIEPNTGKITKRISVISPWQEKDDWQQAGPAVEVAGDRAYVTDAEHRKLHVVDLSTGTVVNTIDLPQTPVELAVTTGKPHGAGAASGEAHSHGPEEHPGVRRTATEPGGHWAAGVRRVAGVISGRLGPAGQHG